MAPAKMLRVRRGTGLLIVLGALAVIPLVTTSGTPARGCGLSLKQLRITACKVLKRDTSSRRHPTPAWGRIDCRTATRHRRISPGGDRHRTAGGHRQGNRAYRRLTVFDGDDVYGERCELGRNSWSQPTFHKYREGQHSVTFVSLRLPRAFPLGKSRWQTLLQMKQAQPSNGSANGPMLEVQVKRGRLFLMHNWHVLWSTAIHKRRWIRIALNVRYSQSRDAGSATIFVDKDGDGDAAGRRESSPAFHVTTLDREALGGSGLAPGQSIPSHLRVGIYHDPAYGCPRPNGCSVQIDNVQVVRAPG